MTTTPAMPELPEPELGYIKTDKSNQPAFSARQMRATLQAQPAAGASDEQIDTHLDVILRAAGSALRHYTMQKSMDDMRSALRRAILALRPQAVPTTDAWAAGVQAAADLLKRMADETALERGETDPDTGAIQFKSAATREWHASLCELAEEIERLKPAHHGITAPAGGEW